MRVYVPTELKSHSSPCSHRCFLWCLSNYDR